MLSRLHSYHLQVWLEFVCCASRYHLNRMILRIRLILRSKTWLDGWILWMRRFFVLFLVATIRIKCTRQTELQIPGMWCWDELRLPSFSPWFWNLSPCPTQHCSASQFCAWLQRASPEKQHTWKLEGRDIRSSHLCQEAVCLTRRSYRINSHFHGLCSDLAFSE